MKNKTNQKGFSLIELLVVVIIIGIIAAIAIPSLLASRRAANEGSAIASTRTLGTAQATFQATNGNGTNYAATLGALQTANLIDATLAGGTKSGYTFTTGATAAAAGAGSGTMCVNAAPTTPGTTGTRYFGMDEDYVLFGGTAASICTGAGVFTPGANVPIQ